MQQMNAGIDIISILALLAGLVVLALLIAGVVVLFIKLRAKAWWVVGPVLGLGLLLLPAGLLVTNRSSSEQAHLDEARSRSFTIVRGEGGSAIIRGGVHVVGDSSDSASGQRISETFLADVYPSALQAAEALATHVAKSFYSSPDELTGRTGKPSRTRYTPTAEAGPAEPNSPCVSAEAADLPDVKVFGTVTPTILVAVADALVRGGVMARGVEIMRWSPAPASRPAPSSKEVICAVRVDGDESGTVQIVLESPDKQVTRAARFVSKPWAANFAQYVAGARGPVVRAMSAPAASFEDAQEEAFDDAATKLAPYVNSAMKSTAPAGGMARVADSQVVHGAILAELRKGTLILDRFGQQFDRPYGKLWREQMLVYASPKAIGPLAAGIAKNAAAARNADRQTLWTLAVSLGGLAVLIFAVYLVLNAATKGYYTWVLRLLALCAVVAGVALALVA